MRESAFITSVVDKLPDCVHSQSLTLASQTHAGTPDRYFDYELDLWVEFKIIREAKLPAIMPEYAVPTEKQQRWLDRRWAAGGNACVLVGHKIKGRVHGFVLESPAEWSVRQSRDFMLARMMDANSLASYLLRRLSR